MHPDTSFSKRDWLHMLPALLYWLSILPDFFISPAELSARLDTNTNHMSPRFLIFNFLLLIQASIYLGLTLLWIQKYHRRLRQVFSSLEKVKLTWLQQITFLLLAGWIVFCLEQTLLMLGTNLTGFNLSSILYALYIFLMGYMAILKSEIFQDPSLVKPMHALETIPDDPSGTATTEKSSRYERSGLDPHKAQQLTQALIQLMETEEPYTNNELTLADLADSLAITPHNLSEILNTQLQQNFYDFINQYRIEKVKRDLADTRKSHLKILSIAFDAGFNSKTAFNTIFKQNTHLTPSDYRQKQPGITA
jgi:AraC-like DNA-binding protein